MPMILCTKEQEQNYLMHHGIIGMKRGVRRWQDEDGNYTPEGRIHYGIGQGIRKIGAKINRSLSESNAKIAEKREKSAALARNRAENSRIRMELKPNAKTNERYKRDLAEANRLTAKAGLSKTKSDIQALRAKNLEDHDNMSKVDQLNAKADMLALKANRSDLMTKANSKTGTGDSMEAKRLMLKSELARNKAEKAELSQDKPEANPDETRKEQIKESRYRNDVENFDNLSRERKKEVGDELMKRFGENVEKARKAAEGLDYKNKEDRDLLDAVAISDNDKEIRKTEQWLFNRMHKYSGNMNSMDFARGSEGEKACKECLDAYDKQNAREDEIKKEIGYKEIPYKQAESNRTRNERKREYERFKKACENDSIWKSLSENSKKADSAICGAVLRDIGLSDTPENRKLIEWYVFID